MSQKRPSKNLGFEFAPIPRWLIDEWSAGKCPDETLHLLAVVYRRANTGLLADRKETPRLSLDQLIADLRYPHERESLRRLLGRLREQDRYLTNRTEGSPRRGIRYVFTLYPDGPNLSANRPPKNGDSRPPIGKEQSRSGSQIETTNAPALSANDGGPEQESRPPDPLSCPPIAESAEPLVEPVSQDSDGLQAPASSACLDVREKTTLRTEERFFEKRLGSEDDPFLAAFERVELEPQPEPGGSALEALGRLREVTRRDRLAELRAIGDGPPAGEDVILAEVEALIADGVLVEREERT